MRSIKMLSEIREAYQRMYADVDEAEDARDEMGWDSYEMCLDSAYMNLRQELTCILWKYRSPLYVEQVFDWWTNVAN